LERCRRQRRGGSIPSPSASKKPALKLIKAGYFIF